VSGTAIDNGMSGTCIITFVVNADGTISDVKVLREFRVARNAIKKH